MGQRPQWFYKKSKALYEKQFDPDGFEWIEHADYTNSVLTYIRKGKGKKDIAVVACNFTPVARENYVFGVPFSGIYKLALNSDDEKYNGTGMKITESVRAKKMEKHDRDYSISVTLPPLSVLIYLPYKKRVVKKIKIN